MKTGEENVPRSAARGRRPPPRPEAGETLARIFRDAIRGEILDARLARWAREGFVGFHLPAAEWGGVLAAAACALEPADWLFPGAREARMALWRGMDLASFLAQHLGAALPDGTFLPGLPGSIADAAHRVASVAGGPGAHLPHAVGAAFAAARRKERAAVLAIASGAAADTADFHVAANFAGVWRAPVVLVLRAELEEAEALCIDERGGEYGIGAARASGGDLPAVRRLIDEALARARAGGGPTLVQIDRPQEPRAALDRLAARLGDALAGEAAVRAQAESWCDEAWQAARAAVRPGRESLAWNVYAAGERAVAGQVAELAQVCNPIPEDV